jgi:hypothetical protein
MTTSTSAIDDIDLIKSFRLSCQEEAGREDHYLEDYSEVEGQQGLFQHDTEKNDFMFRILPEWDDEEGDTYEMWEQWIVDWMAEVTGAPLTSIREVRTGHYWSLFHLT